MIENNDKDPAWEGDNELMRDGYQYIDQRDVFQEFWKKASLEDKLEMIKKLRDKGSITEDEYQKLQGAILKKGNSNV